MSQRNFPESTTPIPLKKGDSIAILAIGKKITLSEIKEAITVYESWGLQVKISSTIGSGTHYLAGTDELKASEFQSYINDPKIKAIIFARGGYGAVRIIDKIDFSPLIKQNKWLVGFSDVTVVHNHLNSYHNLTSIHGIMPVFFPTASNASIHSCRRLLFEGQMSYKFSSAQKNLIKEGVCEGEIVGGNLSIIYSMCGSRSQLKTANKILFLEDLYEPLYHLDRMLQNLKRNKMLEELAGVIIGSFTNIDKGNPLFADEINDVFREYFQDLNIPVYSNFPSGHIDDNHALIFGQKVKMEVRNQTISIKTVN